MGSLVLKEESGYRAFFHHLIRPHEHYLPVWKEVSHPDFKHTEKAWLPVFAQSFQYSTLGRLTECQTGALDHPWASSTTVALMSGRVTPLLLSWNAASVPSSAAALMSEWTGDPPACFSGPRGCTGGGTVGQGQ